jgi:hypothetical protein
MNGHERSETVWNGQEHLETIESERSNALEWIVENGSRYGHVHVSKTKETLYLNVVSEYGATLDKGRVKNSTYFTLKSHGRFNFIEKKIHSQSYDRFSKLFLKKKKEETKHYTHLIDNICHVGIKYYVMHSPRHGVCVCVCVCVYIIEINKTLHHFLIIKFLSVYKHQHQTRLYIILVWRSVIW